MLNDADPLVELGVVLREAGASPRVRRDRIVRSTLYDLDYHVALIACVFFTTAGGEATRPTRVVAHWLKLIQFVAVRPTLIANFQIWANTRRQQDLNTWQKMPRGYLGDTTHDLTVEWLVACGLLLREGDDLIAGARFADLRRIYDDLISRNLLSAERATLLELSQTRVNKTLLKGV